MGPWFIRDETNPFLPGFSLATLRQLVRRGRIVPDTVIKGPSTRQFWSYARNVPGVAHLLGACHVCRSPAKPTDARCAACGVSFEIPDDREHLGLAPVHLLPGHADAEKVAAAASADRSRSPQAPAFGNGTPEPGVDAESLIAARHRRRRAQRRTTAGIVISGLALIGLVVTIMVVQSVSRPIRQAEPGAAGNHTVKGFPSEPLQRSEPEAPAPPGDTGANRDSIGQPLSDDLDRVVTTSPADLARQLLTANVVDLPDLLARAQAMIDRLESTDSRLEGAIEAAKARLAAVRAGEKL